jgi:hypothetical protein
MLARSIDEYHRNLLRYPLAPLWRSQGKTAEARDLLAPLTGWITEGFNTADLKDVKALLDELG